MEGACGWRVVVMAMPVVDDIGIVLAAFVGNERIDNSLLCRMTVSCILCCRSGDGLPVS